MLPGQLPARAALHAISRLRISSSSDYRNVGHSRTDEDGDHSVNTERLDECRYELRFGFLAYDR